MSLLEIAKLPTAENSAIHLHPTDNVAVARAPLTSGQTLRVDGLTLNLPYIHREHEHIVNEEGEPPRPADFRFSGLGDLVATAQWIALGAENRVAVSPLSGSQFFRAEYP